jgi:cytochrome c biogenesis protein CcmG/thiol:disulfide interchange protein DsbE
VLDPFEHDGYADRLLRPAATTRARLLRIVPLVLLGIVAVGLIVLRAPSAAATVKVGAQAPAITGTTLDGQPFDLASLKGRPVLVNFWYPTCVPCREEFPLLVKELQAKVGDDFAVVGVLSKDTPEMARAFAAEMGATWPTVIDKDQAIAKQYLVLGWPQSYYIDRDGVVRALQIGEIEDQDFQANYAKIAG